MMVTPEAAYQELTVYYRKVEDPKYLRVYEGQTDYVLKEKQTYSQEIGLITKEFDHLLEPLFESGYALYNPNKKIAYPFEEKDSEIFLRVVPVVVSLTVKEPHEAFSPMVDYPRLVWPSGLEKSDLSKTLKRTIRYCYNGASETFQEDYQEFELTREATVTLSTGEVRYSSWKTGASGFPSIHPPKVEGYQAEVEVVASRPLKAIQSDEVVTVYYWPLAGVIHIEYRDGSKPIKNDVLVGGIGERVTYQLLSFPGYELAETDCPQTIVFSEEEQSFTVQLQAKRKMVDYQHPLRARSFVQQDGYLLTVPAGLEVENLTYVNQRVIQFLSDTGESLLDEVVQESRVSRLAEWNLATAKVTYGEWLVDSAFSEVSLPEIEGYETSEGPITELTVQATGVTQVIRKQITYHKRPYRFYIRVFEEGAKAALEELVLTVRPGETPLYSLDQLVEAYDHLGYQLLETKVVGEEEFDRHVDLILSARRLSIDSDLVRSDYKGLDEELVTLLRQLPPLYLHQLERGIKRTIRYLSVDRKELVPELVSQVFFEREADMNLVTGEVTFGEWMSSYPTFDATVSPLIPGYQTDKEFMGSIEVTSPEASDIFEEVIYTPTDASIVVDSQEAAPVYQAPALSVVAKKEVVEEEKGEPAAAMVENSFKGSKPAEASGFWSKFKKRFFSK